jgi:hypothetical protein
MVTMTKVNIDDLTEEEQNTLTEILSYCPTVMDEIGAETTLAEMFQNVFDMYLDDQAEGGSHSEDLREANALAVKLGIWPDRTIELDEILTQCPDLGY